MTAMPIRATVKPSSLNGQANGSIAPHLLQMVDREALVWQMAEYPARGMRALHAAVKAEFGVQLSSTGRGRTFEQQYSLFIQRHEPVSYAVYAKISSSGAKRRIWPDALKYGFSSIYWRLKAGYAAAAVPGTSPHGWFCADDICLPGNIGITARPDILEWLYVNEMRYGFAHSLLSEPWHLQWFVGDAMPQAVLDYERSLLPPVVKPPVETPPPVVVPPVTVPPVAEGDFMLGIIQIEGAAASFSGWTNAAGNFLTVSWIQTENEYVGLKAAGAKVFTYPASTMQWVGLVGPVPTGDAGRNWTVADFKFVVS